jgi:MoxR-like ATPase
VQRLPVRPDDQITLPTSPGAPEQVHVFSEKEILAIDTALAARRALLVRGEPGIGKTQLARAAAIALKRPFVSLVVDARTESHDLLWHFDALARLGEAQLLGALRIGGGESAPGGEKDIAALRKLLSIENFIHPGPLWWAFDWDSAAAQAGRVTGIVTIPPDGCDPANGVVVLIDEIDKAESDVPNGLLEALGSGEFTPRGTTAPIRAKGVPPLVLVTTNEERPLPDAFVRRCLVLQLRLPEASEKELIDYLERRATAHFPDTDSKLLELAVKQLIKDRAKARQEHWLPLPGQAEFIDLLRAVRDLAPCDPASQCAQLERIAGFALRKHPGAEA